jgi:hypothetical protein
MKSNVIYKYPLNGFEFMAAVIKFLNVGMDPGEKPCVWVLVDPSADEQEKKIWKIYKVGTGWRMDDKFFNNKIYLGTLTEGAHVWHYWAGVLDGDRNPLQVTEQMSSIEQDIVEGRA